MEISNIMKSVSPLEIILAVCFIIYIIFPIPTPTFLEGVFNSSLGMLSLFVITLFLFFYISPILGILFIVVAYEMMNRGLKITHHTSLVQYTPSQEKKDVQMKKMNPVKKESLEEEIISKMAPVGHSELSIYTPSTFKPVAEKVGSASLV